MTAQATEASESLTMYTTTWCGYCVRLKRQLTEADIPFVEVNIETNDDAAAFVMRVNDGDQTVPTVRLPDGTALTNPSIRQVKRALKAST